MNCDLCGATTHNEHGFDACHEEHAGFSGYNDECDWFCTHE